MSVLFLMCLVLGFSAVPVIGAVAARAALGRREEAQKLLVDRYAHLSPRRAWRVAYSSEAHVQSVFKFWSWEDVGVLHLYDEALAFYGGKGDFELGREEILDLRVDVFHRTNPWVYWVVVETTGGLHAHFCLPEGYHVFGMKDRARRLLVTLKKWASGSTVRPLMIE